MPFMKKFLLYFRRKKPQSLPQPTAPLHPHGYGTAGGAMAQPGLSQALGAHLSTDTRGSDKARELRTTAYTFLKNFWLVFSECYSKTAYCTRSVLQAVLHS